MPRLSLFLCFFLIIHLASCAQSIAPDDYPKPVEGENGKRVYVDSKGNQIIPGAFDVAQPFFGDIAVVQKKDKDEWLYGLINVKGEMTIPFGRYFIRIEGRNFAVKEEGNSHTIYDKNGKALHSCKNCRIRYDETLGRIEVRPDEYSGAEEILMVLDSEGREIFRHRGIFLSRLYQEFPEEPGREPESLPYYQATFRNKAGKENGPEHLNDILTLSGKLLMDSVQITGFQKGIASLSRNGLSAVLDTNLTEVVPFSWGYSFIRPLYDFPGMAYMVSKSGKFGIISPQNKTILPLEYPYHVEYNHKGKVFMYYHHQQNGWYILNLKGDTTITPDYSIRTDVQNAAFNEGVPVVDKKTSKMGYMKGDGTFIIPARYDFLSEPHNGKIVFFSGERSGYLSIKGKLLLELKGCECLSIFSEGFAVCGIQEKLVKKGSSAQTQYSFDGEPTIIRYRWFDSTGVFLSENLFDWVYPFINGYAMVLNNHEQYLINRKGAKVLINGQYTLISYFHNGLAIAFDPKSRKYGLADEKLNLIVPVEYDGISTSQEETPVYLPLYDRGGHKPNGGFENFYLNIVDGKLKVIKAGKEEIISIR